MKRMWPRESLPLRDGPPPASFSPRPRPGPHPLRRQADPDDAVGGDEAPAEEPLGGGGDGPPPVVRILLRAAAGEEQQVRFLELMADDLAVRGGQSDFGSAGAEIDSKDVRGAVRPAG